MNDDCLFCKLVEGIVPIAAKVFEDEDTLAFLDIFPVTEGMTLVIPKIHISNWWEMDDTLLTHTMTTAKRVAVALRSVYPKSRIGVQIEGLDVPHAHIKLIPFTTSDEYASIPNRQVPPDFTKLTKVADNLRNHIL